MPSAPLAMTFSTAGPTISEADSTVSCATISMPLMGAWISTPATTSSPRGLVAPMVATVLKPRSWKWSTQMRACSVRLLASQ